MTATADSAQAAGQSNTVATLLRLGTWARPHRRAIAFMLASASGAMVAQSLVPIVVGRVVEAEGVRLR